MQESEAAGATVSAVARRHGIATGILFRWRAEFGVAQKKQAKLASLTLATDAAAALALQILVRPPDGMMAIELPDGRQSLHLQAVILLPYERSSTAEGLQHDNPSGGGEGASGAGAHRHAEGARPARHAGPSNAEAGPVLGSSVCLQGKKASLLKIVFWDGNGLCLFTKRLEQGSFVWPRMAGYDGSITLTPAQLAMLIEGIDWRAPERVTRPALAG